LLGRLLGGCSNMGCIARGLVRVICNARMDNVRPTCSPALMKSVA
jgi:hypothetical protein